MSEITYVNVNDKETKQHCAFHVSRSSPDLSLFKAGWLAGFLPSFLSSLDLCQSTDAAATTVRWITAPSWLMRDHPTLSPLHSSSRLTNAHESQTPTTLQKRDRAKHEYNTRVVNENKKRNQPNAHQNNINPKKTRAWTNLTQFHQTREADEGPGHNEGWGTGRGRGSSRGVAGFDHY